jgi:uncharacterized protein YjbI with pentapeptide repeats
VTGANFYAADLSRATLRDKDLTGTTLAAADLSRAYLAGANLTGRVLTDTNLTSADLTGATLTNTTLTNTTLTGANLTNTTLTGANLTNTTLTGANLTGANLTGANLTGQDLRGNKLSRVNFTDADLTRTNLAGIRFDQFRTTLTRANLTEADLAGANLQGVSLQGANLTDANLAGISLKGLDLTGTTLVRAKLGDKVDLTGSKLIGANLTGQNLVSANLTGVDASNANFTDANLTEAVLANTELYFTNMTRANLTGANLITAKSLRYVNWTGTRCPRGGSGPCSPFATVPGPEYTDGYRTWYNYQAPATPVIPSTAMAGTPGAPIIGGSMCAFCNDGAQGTIENLSGQRIVVQTVLYGNGGYIRAEAILEPSAKMPYRLYEWGPSELQFFPAPEGKPLGDPTELSINDTTLGDPTTSFRPPGFEYPIQFRTYGVQDFHLEEWGDVRLWVKRERDGWKIGASQEYKDRYGDPDLRPNDYAIFTIEVLSL